MHIYTAIKAPHEHSQSCTSFAPPPPSLLRFIRTKTPQYGLAVRTSKFMMKCWL